jgi:hypothetical protein
MDRRDISTSKTAQKVSSRTFVTQFVKREAIAWLVVVTLAVTPAFAARRSGRPDVGNSRVRGASSSIFVYPRFDCVDYDPASGSATAYFGYSNLGSDPVTILKGINNEFIQVPSFRNQPVTFAPGVFYKVFSTTFDTTVGLNWVLNGVFATATTDSIVRCKDTPVTTSATGFTYQGRLTDGGLAANGTYQMQFLLYDALTGGGLQGSPTTVTNASVLVTNGVFTVPLDFGMAGFNGADRFLEIAVKHTGDATYTTLSPRQQLTPTPYALHANTADLLSGLTADLFLQKTGDTMTGTLSMSGKIISNLGAPVNGADAANKSYVDNAIGGRVNKSGDTMTGTLSLPPNGLILGTNQLTTSGGNVGVGTAAPNSALQVAGYLQIDVTSGDPPATDCNSATQYGRMKLDPTSRRFYLCTSQAWKSVTLQ